MEEAVTTVEEAESAGSFMIKFLYEFKIGDVTLHITTTHISLLIITLVLLIFAIVINRTVRNADENKTPGTLQNIGELIVETLINMVNGIMGKTGRRFFNYIATLFLFAGVSNISGLFGLRPPTADYGVTLLLGLVTFCIVQYTGIKTSKLGHFTGLFQPVWFLFPINLIGELAVPISLSLRLFGNVLSGTVIMGLLYGLVGEISRLCTIVWPAALHIYFDIFSGCIQAYVIAMLTMVYITDKAGDE